MNHIFLTRHEYLQQLVDAINKTTKGDRVAVATMSFEPKWPATAQLVEALSAAAQRGTDTHLMIDAIAFMVTDQVVPGPLLFSKKLPDRHNYIFNILEKMREHGVKYTVTNIPTKRFKFPFAGRSHIKFGVVNDDAFIGGCNLGNYRTDIMIRQTSSQLSDYLFDIAVQSHTQSNVCILLKGKDNSMELDSETTFLIDAGAKNQSIIFEKALNIIDQADKYIFMTCQYFPNDITIARLDTAVKRGVDVKLVYNHPSKRRIPMNFLHYVVKFIEKIRRDPKLFEYELSKQSTLLHSKVIVSEKASLVGSHNYIKAGVAFGTAEIALMSTSQDFANKVIHTIEEQI